MQRGKIKLKKLDSTLTPQLLTVYLIIVCIMLLSSATYAFWTQTPATQSDIVLEADSVTYLTSYLNPENADDLLTPPIAAKDSLKNNNITVETPASVVERLITFRLMGKTACNILINCKLYYLNSEEIYLEIPEGVMDVGVWYDPDGGGTQEGYTLGYDGTKNGYYIASFPYEQAASVTVSLSFAVVDELLDPAYKGTQIKTSVAFAAEKIEGV